MESLIATIFCTLCCGAGLFYIVRPTGAERIAGIESASRNRLRHRLRRVCGLVLIALGLAIFWGVLELRRTPPTVQVFIAWFVVLIMLILAIWLAVIDAYMTHRTYKNARDTMGKP